MAVVVPRNIVRMALCSDAVAGRARPGLFFLAGADFVGAMQLMIYVGGTLVLLIFGVMLTAQGPFVSMKTAGGDWIVAVMLSGCLAALLVPAAFASSIGAIVRPRPSRMMNTRRSRLVRSALDVREPARACDVSRAHGQPRY